MQPPLKETSHSAVSQFPSLTPSFLAPFTRRIPRTEQASVCGLVGESSYCSKSPIDRSRRELPILEENAVAGDHNLVERQSRLVAVPLNKFIDGVSISALGLG